LMNGFANLAGRVEAGVLDGLAEDYGRKN
jgi:hypothetical protein